MNTAAPLAIGNWPPHPTSAKAARAFVYETLELASISGDIVDSAVLLTSELVTNAVLHANTNIEVRIYNNGEVRIEVRDGCDRDLVRRENHDESVVGRGLALVEVMATSYGWAPDGTGKVVWFELGANSFQEDPGWRADTSRNGSYLVQLRQMPVVLYQVMREHNEALLREYMLEGFSDNSKARFTPEDVRQAELARDALVGGYLEACSALPAGAEMPDYVDVTVAYTYESSSQIALLQEVLEDAERLASDGVLLTRPVLHELRVLREWFLYESLRQLAGEDPKTWGLHYLPDDSKHDVSVPPEMSWVSQSESGVIAGNADNRVTSISPSASRILGWEPDDLVGRRIVVIIPPQLREKHVAGFTRHLVTGRSTILGSWIEIAAWHHDGYEVPVRLRLESQTTAQGTNFVAWIEDAKK